jgi:hypothetical protein
MKMRCGDFSGPHRQKQQLQPLLIGLDLSGPKNFMDDLFKMERWAIGRRASCPPSNKVHAVI